MTAARAVVMRALGRFGDRRLDAGGRCCWRGWWRGWWRGAPAACGGWAGGRGALLLARMVARMVSRATVCLRRLGWYRGGEVRFGRLLANPAVSLERPL